MKASTQCVFPQSFKSNTRYVVDKPVNNSEYVDMSDSLCLEGSYRVIFGILNNLQVLSCLQQCGFVI